jgi:hypothetical protein
MDAVAAPTTTNSSFTRTNNDAVRLFQGGKHDASTMLLQESLMIVRTKLVTAPPPETIPLSSSASSNRQHRLLIQGIPLNEAARSRIEVDNSSGLTFFDRMFLIGNGSGNDVEVDDNLLEDRSDSGTEWKVCAVILYNIGAAHHLAGLATGSHEELDKAYRVYQMAIEFLQMESAKDGAANDSVLLLLSMAVMNNIAYIQGTSFNYGEVCHCTRWLREAAEHMEAPLLRDDDFMFFFLRYYVIPPFKGIFSSPAA